MQLGNAAQLDALAEFMSQKTRVRVEAGRRCRDLVAGAERRKKYLGMRIVGADLGVGQGHHADARVLDLEPDQIREFTLDLLGNAQRAGIIARHGNFRIEDRGTKSEENQSRSSLLYPI